MSSAIAAVLDVGTTKIKAMAFNSQLTMLRHVEADVKKTKPQSGWVEQDAEEIWQISQRLLAQIIGEYPGEYIQLGITNQRETVVAWGRESGKALHNALVWEDHRGAELCQKLIDKGHDSFVRHRTGLHISPYSSASKIRWLLDQEQITQHKDLVIGTLDSWLAYKLTGQAKTDYTNACRTLLYDIRRHHWDDTLLELFNIPKGILPALSVPGEKISPVDKNIFNRELDLVVTIGDQQSSLFAAGGDPGTCKITYGTGVFPMRIVGSRFILHDSLMTTLAIGGNLKPVYAWEGKIDNAAARVSPVLNKPKELYATMMTIAQETQKVLDLIIDDSVTEIVVDGGISQNNDILHRQAELSHKEIIRQKYYEGTALGVAKYIFSRTKKSDDTSLV